MRPRFRSDSPVDLNDSVDFMNEVVVKMTHQRSLQSLKDSPAEAVEFTPIRVRNHRLRKVITSDNEESPVVKKLRNVPFESSDEEDALKYSLVTPRTKSRVARVKRRTRTPVQSNKATPKRVLTKATLVKKSSRRKSATKKKEPTTPIIAAATCTRYGRAVKAPQQQYQPPKPHKHSKKKVEENANTKKAVLKKDLKAGPQTSTPTASSARMNNDPVSPILPSTSALPSTPTTTKKLIWTSKNKRELVAGFETFNPVTDNDWMEIVNLLKQKFTVEECKEQAKRMKLISSRVKVDKALEEAEARIRRLIPNGKIPQKGTISREKLEHEFYTQMMRMAAEKEQHNPLMDLMSESQEQIVLEAARDHALDESLMNNRADYESRTPTRRIFMPRIFVNRSMDESHIKEDSFAIPDNAHEMRYMFKLMAERKGKQLAKRGQKIAPPVLDPVDDELSD